MQDVFLVKTDSNGNELWNKTYGGPQNDVGYWLANTPDGGYIITGYTYSYTDGMAAYLIKTDANGNMLWNKTFGGLIKDCGDSVVPTNDGGFIIAGYSKTFGHITSAFMDVGGEDLWLIKTDSNGNEIWNKTYGGNDTDIGYAVIQTQDNGYLVAGETYSFNNNSHNNGILIGGNTEQSNNAMIYLVKTDSQGNEQWNKTYGGTGDEAAFSLTKTLDGGYIVTGGASSPNTGGTNAYTLKVNSSGDKEWDTITSGVYSAMGHSIIPTNDGGYIIAGSITANANDKSNALLFKMGGNSSAAASNMSGSSIFIIGAFLLILLGGVLVWFVLLRKNK